MIDPPGSIDLDDALTVEPIADGGWALTVHVAATAAAVVRDSEHDRLARARVASQYLPRRTIPMLGEIEREVTLSDRLDRLALTITATFDAAGQRTAASVRQSFLPAGTCVRMSYQDVPKVLHGREHHLYSTLDAAHRLAQRLFATRSAAGAATVYDLVHGITVTEDGQLTEIPPAQRTVGYLINTELMVAASGALADWCIDEGLEVLYRNHQSNLLSDGRDIAADLAVALHDPGLFEQLAQRVTRTFGRARYEARPRGHHGLRLPAYAHVTSPLRRYADLVTQRIVWNHLAGGPDVYTSDELAAIAAEINTSNDAKRNETADHFKRMSRKVSARHILDRNYDALDQKQWRKMFDLMTATGPAAGIEAELCRRLDENLLVANDIARLATTSSAWDGIRKRFFAKVREARPEFGPGALSGRAQILGIDHSAEIDVQNHPGRPIHRPLFAARARLGDSVGRWQIGESKKAASTQAVWELLDVVCGHTASVDEAVCWPADPPPAAAPADLQPAAQCGESPAAAAPSVLGEMVLPEAARRKVASMNDAKMANAFANPVGWLTGFAVSQSLGAVEFSVGQAGPTQEDGFTSTASLAGVTCTAAAKAKTAAKVAAATALLRSVLAAADTLGGR